MHFLFTFIVEGLKVLNARWPNHPIYIYLLAPSQCAHCPQCIVEFINRLFCPGNCSQCCQGVHWASVHSQPTDRFWIVAANRVGWSGRRQARSREILCVWTCDSTWMTQVNNTRETTISKGKRGGTGHIFNIRSGTSVRHCAKSLQSHLVTLAHKCSFILMVFIAGLSEVQTQQQQIIRQNADLQVRRSYLQLITGHWSQQLNTLTHFWRDVCQVHTGELCICVSLKCPA